ncbi:MAG TPA: aspartyl protease family protein [Saprospiraceae bacterium]|nr:aspartyl protease family protein [Saprospiraceae bacterium]HMP13423.1 aspartyl protease family protein [Saprospiraceae bacterium]
MKKCTLLLVLLYLILDASLLPAQSNDMIIRRGVRKVEIPFEYENNFIIIRVIFNDVFPLKFIFDTGAEHTILTRREITDLLQINYDRKFPIRGSDLSVELYAYLARGVKLTMNSLVAQNRSILVLEDDYFRFEEFGGINVHGILGADLFRRFIVKIDYRKKIITLYDPEYFSKPSGQFQEMAMELHRNKPYIVAPTQLNRNKTIEGKYLIDTGASISLLLYTNTYKSFELPSRYVRSKIGMGLGGYLQGFIGRIERIQLGDFALDGVITNFQEISPEIDSSFLNKRNGIIGNQLLNRFVVIIDYIGEKIYLQPDRGYRRSFQYDKSGLIIAASGSSLNEFSVVDVIANSPAEEAGIQIGDEIKSVNGVPTSFMHLADLSRRFYARSGKKINLIIKRNDTRIKKTFRLRELL